MLKVLKYDWKNGWNSVRLLLIGAAIASAVFGISAGLQGGRPVIDGKAFGIMGQEQLSNLTGILMVVWFSIMVALLVLTVDAILKNLSGRMFGPEGCLTHTLPVEVWELLAGKALGTWIFGVFMVFVAFAALLLAMAATIVGAGSVMTFVRYAVEMLPKLGAYHFRQLAEGMGYFVYGLGAFLIWSLLLVIQFQFVCIASRLFGKYHIAGAVIITDVLFMVENNINTVISMGFVIVLLASAACFYGSCWLLKHKLSI